MTLDTFGMMYAIAKPVRKMLGMMKTMVQKKKRMPSSQKALQKRHEDGDPTMDLLGEPLGKFGFYVIYEDIPPPKFDEPSPCKPDKPPPIPPCYEKALNYLRKNPSSSVKPKPKPVAKP